ncbi:Holliday junction branch migration protein RuvA [Iamia majanohamensis]|uniref:Holliday junction branch migration complex subunit RuvA n=1 Tax=Iamia majanohamensis TaxID=467976 RepID=A0AAE9Y9A1_9ACTN|nr:Holliday junction branch migration protein RuvA [Iamia majanohamensis]WCO68982.1 Holliday junction branch migration protein RuvA [Iamia majanohamensis]
MIGSLRGTLVERSPDGELLVEVGGVGYRVLAGPPTAARLGDLGAEVRVWTHHHVREDAQVLYGFATRDERVAFEALISAHGVGPALALAILSVHEPLSLRRVLADDDVSALCLVPGVGKKTAARLLVELKSRLEVPEGDLGVAATSAGGPASGNGATSGSVRSDVRDALAALGYSTDEIAEATRDLPGGDDVSALVSEALRRMVARR